MRRSLQAVVVQGAVGGLLAGFVVALWFFVADSVAGHPFRTPTVLANAFFGGGIGTAPVRWIATYTALHFGVFAVLGAAMAWAIAPLEAPPRMVLGVLFGILAEVFIFYTALRLTGVRLLAVVPLGHVFGSTILGGVLLMAYLHRAGRDPRPFGPAALKGHPLLAQGLMTGVVGAAVMALWFFILDLARGRPLYTPAALGSALLLGASEVGQVHVKLGVVAAYTVVHIAAFAMAGVLFVGAAERLARTPALLLLVAMTFVVLEAIAVAIMAVGAEWVLGTLGWWAVAAGNLLAVFAMGWLVWATHADLRRGATRLPG